MSIVTAKHFWDWFQLKNNESHIVDCKTKEESSKWFRELCNHLQLYYDADFRPLLITIEELGKAAIIFTAEGEHNYFNKIEELVQTAPQLERWRFVALMPPMPPNATLEKDFPSIDLEPDELFFAPDYLEPVDGRYNLQVFVKEETGINADEMLCGFAAQIVYNVLGEKTTGLNINEIRVSYLDDVPIEIRYTVVPLPQLPQYLPIEILTSYTINDQGELTQKPWVVNK
ncbi:MAG: hypothetical protein J7621_13445 [Niastella sp.]|nr:hypothetical protein [Niastella sp.]